MKFSILLLLSLILFCCHSHFMLLEQYKQFEKYAEEYGKSYSNIAMKLYRFKVYLDNLK